MYTHTHQPRINLHWHTTVSLSLSDMITYQKREKLPCPLGARPPPTMPRMATHGFDITRRFVHVFVWAKTPGPLGQVRGLGSPAEWWAPLPALCGHWNDRGASQVPRTVRCWVILLGEGWESLLWENEVDQNIFCILLSGFTISSSFLWGCESQGHTLECLLDPGLGSDNS